MSSGAKNFSLLFIQHGCLADGYGGVEYYLHDFVTMAAQLFGWDKVRTVSPVPFRSSWHPREYQFRAVARPKVALLSRLENRVPWRLYRTADQMIRESRPSLLVCAHTSMAPIVYALSKKHRIPYVTCVYGIDCWGLGDLKRHDDWALRRSDKIISISEWTKSQLVARNFPADQIAIVHPRLPAHFENVIPSSQKPAAPFTLLTISRLSAGEAYKGHDHVIEAIALLKKWSPGLSLRYRIVGEGNDKQRLQELTRARRLESLVEFLPAFRDRAQLERLYRECDVFIMPSRYGKWSGRWRGEGFGIVYVEAAAFEKPSIAYACGGATDIITSEKDGILVPPDDIHALARAIGTLLDSPAKVARLGGSARRMVRERFTEEPIQREMKKAFSPYWVEPVSSSKHFTAERSDRADTLDVGSH